MCFVIVMSLLALCAFFVDDHLQELSLVAGSGADSTTLALGWEMVPQLWPLMLLFFLLGLASVLLAWRLRAFWQFRQERKASKTLQH